MRYTYTAAWEVVGGVQLPEGSSPVVLASSKNKKFILTQDPDTLLTTVDEISAVANLLIKGLTGTEPKVFQAALASEIEGIKAERKKKIRDHAVLIFQTQGQIEASVQRPLREFDTFIVTFDAIEKNIVRQQHMSDIAAMKVAIAFKSDYQPSFTYLNDGTCLYNDAEKPVYSYSASLKFSLSTSKPFPKEEASQISDLYEALDQNNDLNSVVLLFTQMTDNDTNRLKAFLSGWAALEILIAKSFKIYEQEFLSTFTNAEQATLRERFLARIKDVMKDKYRLKEKFMAVTVVLFPSLDDAEVERYLNDFNRLKGLRDSIFHGETFPEEDLPVHEIAALLRKYIIARIAPPSKTFPSEKNSTALTSHQ